MRNTFGFQSTKKKKKISHIQAEYKNAQGRTYWYHPGERRSVWDKPDELKSARERAMDSTPWREYKSGERSYYVNKETKQSTWTIPADLQAYLNTIPDDPPPAVPARSSASPHAHASPAGSATPPTNTSTGASATASDAVTDALGPGTAAPRSSTNTSVSVRNLSPVYATHEEAEAAFMSMLQRKNVGPTSTWEQTLREIITDPLYKALRTLAERKAVFHKYVDDQKAQEAVRREEKAAELRPKVASALQQELGGLKPYASFATFRKKLLPHALWAEIDDEQQAHAIYEAIHREVQEKENARLEAIRAQSRTNWLALLTTMELHPTSRWHDVYRAICDSDTYRQNPQLQTMHFTDQLAVFEEHMAKVEAEERERLWGHAHSRRDRQARDAFRALLQDSVDKGTLHARSTWASYFPNIRDDERLKAMTQTASGSSAQDLFYDVLDTLERDFAVHRRTVQAHMRANNIHVTSTTDSDAWHNAFRSADAPDSIRMLPDHMLRALFDECVYQSERDARDARRRTERRLRHHADDLRYAFKHMEPPLDIEASFDDILPRIRTLPEYDVLARAGEDGLDTARSAWDRFVRRQSEKLADAMNTPGRSRTDYTDLDDSGGADEHRKRKEHLRSDDVTAVDPRAVRRRTEYDI